MNAPGSDSHLEGGPVSTAEQILYGNVPMRGLGEPADRTDDGIQLYGYSGAENFITEYRTIDGDTRKIVVQGGHKLIIADFKINGVDPEDTVTLYLRSGRLHRDDDLPAVEISCGEEWWFMHGVKHREVDASGASRPAVIGRHGREYWRWGQLHRHDGKAKVDVWGDNVWAWFGEQYKRHDLWLEAKQSHPSPEDII